MFAIMYLVKTSVFTQKHWKCCISCESNDDISFIHNILLFHAHYKMAFWLPRFSHLFASSFYKENKRSMLQNGFVYLDNY